MDRFLGLVDIEDFTNVPIGASALVRNACFDGLASARTRDGINLTMLGVNKVPITGLIGMLYTPEASEDSFFQLPMIFDYAGALQYESPVGSGRMNAVQTGLFVPPTQAHMIATQVANKGWLAFSDLTQPKSQCAVFNPKTRILDPYGMKPVGWTWLPKAQVLIGEVATPTAPGGNGHTYRCTQAGTTGGLEPHWPTTESATVTDGTVVWTEQTMVLANRIPQPAAPVLTRQAGGGTFPAGRDVYVVLTLLNQQGETIPSVSAVLKSTNASDGVGVAIPALAAMSGWIQTLATEYVPKIARLYEADVSTGAAAPAETLFSLVGTFNLGSNVTITNTATGAEPPTRNSARITPGQVPAPDVEPEVIEVSSGGNFAAGRDIYVLQTYVNANGETTAGPASSIVDTEANDGVQVTIAIPSLYPQIQSVGIYECDVPTGKPAPPSSEFALVGYYGAANTPMITATASGPTPPIVNGTGPAGVIVADTATGGLNGTQGHRYAAVMYMNRNYTVSGFTAASVVKYDVDEDGWQLGVFNIPTGPDNIVARIVAFSAADGTNAGPFFWIGNFNPQVPSQNFVYPDTFVSDGEPMSATIFDDNRTASGTVNFTDEYLLASNDATDRLRCIWPYPAVHIQYCPSVDRIFCTGVDGYYSGTWVSLAADYESFYGDTSFISVGSDDGERAWGVCEFRNAIYLMRERSAMVLSANPSRPDEWVARERWSKVGACGPRAFDSCGDFIVFVHRSGVYTYETQTPTLVTKELPHWWATINWQAAETICCRIDEETKTVRVLLPVNGSTVPNQELAINYLSGWRDPIYFSIYSAKELAVPVCRKASVNDVAAFVVERLERTLPVPGDPGAQSIAGIPTTDRSFYTSQICYGSSGYDGGVHAITPGVFSDNGAGIDFQIETVCPQTSMVLSKAEGFSLNAMGNGEIYPYLVGGRQMTVGQREDGPVHDLILPLRPFSISTTESRGISRMAPSKLNERWRLRFTNGKVPGSWVSLKWLSLYTIPMYTAREEGENSR